MRRFFGTGKMEYTRHARSTASASSPAALEACVGETPLAQPAAPGLAHALHLFCPHLRDGVCACGARGRKGSERQALEHDDDRLGGRWGGGAAAARPHTNSGGPHTRRPKTRRGRTRSAAQRRGGATAQRACLRDGGVVSHAHPPRRPSPRAPPAPSPALRNGVTAAVPAKQPRVRLQEDREAAALAGSTGALEPSGAAAAARAPGAPRAGGRRADVAGAVALKRGGKADYRAPWWTTDCKMAAP